MAALRPWTQAFAQWVAPARPTADLPRLFIGLITAEFGFMAGGIAVGSIILGLTGTVGPGDDPRPLFTVLELLSFAGFALATVAAARWLHRRDLWDLLGTIDLRHLRLGVVIAGAAGILPLVLYDTSGLTPHQSIGAILLWAPLGLIAVAVQTGSEELFFRGYLQTQLAARFDSALAWMVVPSAYFAALHVDLAGWLDAGTLPPAEVEMALWAFAFGLLTADLARVSGGLMAAWGWHIGLNAMSIFGIAPLGDMSDLALFVVPGGGDMAGHAAPFDAVALSAEITLLVITWAAIRLAMAQLDARDAEDANP